MLRVNSVYLVFAIVGLIATVSSQDLPIIYKVKGGIASTVCPATHDLRENITQDIRLLIKNSILPSLMDKGSNISAGYGVCGCGGPGWRRAAYLNMSDPRQTCPPPWELISSPRRSCSRPSNATIGTCYSAMFPTQGIQYFQVCGRIIGYQFGQPQAFFRNLNNIDDQYVDGVSITYGNPRQHIWTFANELDETSTTHYSNHCPCTAQHPINVIPTFVGNDYFCETGVPPGQSYTSSAFYANDPLWDGQGCGPTSTCCTFNNPPWFCKQLPQSTNADLEARLCSFNVVSKENTPIELMEIYVK